MGYYIHLVVDDFYMHFTRESSMNDNLPHSAEDAAVLHNDYRILNSYILDKYKIKNTLVRPGDFEAEPVYKIAHFRLDGFWDDMMQDFIKNSQGKTYYLTEAMLDEFADHYVPLAAEELTCVLNGQYYLNAIDYAWVRTV